MPAFWLVVIKLSAEVSERIKNSIDEGLKKLAVKNEAAARKILEIADYEEEVK
jgi:hypothetical protein